LKDVADYASRLTVAIGGETLVPLGTPPSVKHVFGSGVFVRRDWYLASCEEAVTIKEPEIAFAIPPHLGKIDVGPSIMGAMGNVTTTDSLRLTIIKAPMTGELDYVPKVEPDLPEVGKRVFLYGVENGFAPSFTPVEGRVVRIGTSPSHSLGSAAIFSTLPFGDTYCGAPVISEEKSLVGIMISGADNGESEIMPARRIIRLMEADKAKF
jgi:hypothetical protein